jgi:DNA-binding CsgD family transcriptional regulator
MLAGAGEADDAYAEALRLHAELPDPFARARAHLAYGSHLRRTRRRAAAREQLTAAMDLLVGLHAVPWQQRVRRELRAAGVGTRRQAPPTTELTAQETQIALSVAEGRTNREVAALMYLSAKTVEYHLGHVYTKLGIRSRLELVRHFAGRAGV